MSPGDFNLRHLRVLAAVIRRGSFSAAAREIGVSQPAVSQAIARLEATAGTLLVVRGAGEIGASEAGVLLGARGEAAAAALAAGFRSRRAGGIGGAAASSDEVTMAQVTALAALAEAGSYAAAATSLGLAQPSLHRSVGELERLAGTPLVERRGRGTALTQAGERLARACRLALAELQAGLDELAVLAGRDQGRIRIGAHPAALSGLLPAAIARFLAEHPPVRIAVEPDAPAGLIGGRLDALVTLDSAVAATDGLTRERLTSEPLVIAARAGHPLARGGAPGLVRLAGFGWALLPAGTPEHGAWEQLFLAGGVYPPSGSVTCHAPAALLDLAARSDLLTIASSAAVAQAGPGLAAIGPPLDARLDLALVTRAGWAPSPAQAAFLDEVRAAAATILAF